jgi:hypothetical protein
MQALPFVRFIKKVAYSHSLIKAKRSRVQEKENIKDKSKNKKTSIEFIFNI